ncbi:MAG: FkbM family methyltransferase, partial [Dolichospermum sp.]
EISKKILTYKKNKNQEIFCIDIGTHIGTWTIPISFHSDFVISFEPASETFYRLEYNLKLNEIKNVFPFRSAIVPIKSSILELHVNTTGNSGKSSLIKEWSLSNVSTEK